ncbi:2-oxoglutarate and iron-dependent oxygenase domain-containing protein [Streptomyces sp. JNUCC 64]
MTHPSPSAPPARPPSPKDPEPHRLPRPRPLHPPVIDLGAAVRGPQARRLFHAQLHDAAHRVGCFHLVGHGVGTAETLDLDRAVRRFFALPEADRRALDIVNSPHFRGYDRGGPDHHGPVRDGGVRVGHGQRDGELPREHDRFTIGAERPARPPFPGRPPYGWLQGPNQWPAALPGLRTAALSWMTRLSGVATRLLRELLTAIGAPPGFYDPLFGADAHPVLRLVRHSPAPAPAAPVPGPPVPAGSVPGPVPVPGATTDGGGDGDGDGPGAPGDAVTAPAPPGFLTLLLQDEAGGLRVQREDGAFHEVPPVPGALLVTLGGHLEAATGGYLASARHRLVSPPGAGERFSTEYSHHPRPDARVDPPPFPHAPRAPGVFHGPDGGLSPEFGRDEWRSLLRAHPEAAARHHAERLVPA